MQVCRINFIWESVYTWIYHDIQFKRFDLSMTMSDDVNCYFFVSKAQE